MKYFPTKGISVNSMAKAKVKLKRKKKTQNKRKTLSEKTKKLDKKKKLPNDSSKILNSKNVHVLKQKCENKVKTLRISFDASRALAQQQIINSLVNAKCSLGPQSNLKLYNMVSKAIKANVPWGLIESTLQYNENPKINKNCSLLELKYKQKVFLLVSLRSPNIYNFKKLLTPILKKFKCLNVPVMQHFNYNCRIEALAPYSTATDFAEFEKNFAKDAISCQAHGVGIMDYEIGAVFFQCLPIQLPALVENLEKKNYKVLFTNYGLEAKRKVYLDHRIIRDYKNLLSELHMFKEVENCYDNLEKSQ